MPPFVLFFNLLYPMRRVNDPRSRAAAAAGGCVLVRADALARAGGLQAIRGEVIDPELETMTITIPEVRMSPDLGLATAYVMPLGNADAAKAVTALERNSRFLRGAVAKRVNLQFAATIRFRIDESFEKGARIDALLRSPAVRRDLEPGAADDADSD